MTSAQPRARPGQPRFGDRAGERAVVHLVAELRARGLGARAIAQVLNETGLPSRTGRAWTRGSAGRVIARIDAGGPVPNRQEALDDTAVRASEPPRVRAEDFRDRELGRAAEQFHEVVMALRRDIRQAASPEDRAALVRLAGRVAGLLEDLRADAARIMGEIEAGQQGKPP